MKWMLLITLVAAAPLFGASSTTTTTSSAPSELALPSNTRQPLKLLERTAQFIARNSYNVNCGRNLWQEKLPQELKNLLDKTYWQTAANIRTFAFAKKFQPEQIAAKNKNLCIRLTFGGMIQVWDIYNSNCLASITNPCPNINFSVDLSPDNSKLSCASEDDETMHIYDVLTGKLLYSLSGRKDKSSSSPFSPDGSKIYSISSDGKVNISNALTGQPLVKLLTCESEEIYSGQFSPDGKKICLVRFDKSVKIWDTLNGNLLATIFDHNIPDSVIFSPDSQKICTVSFGNEVVKLWSTSTGDLVNIFDHNGLSAIHRRLNVDSAAFSSDGSTICSASHFGIIFIWDTLTGKLLNQFSNANYNNRNRSLQFSPDGTMICFTTNDNTIRLCDVKTGEELNVLSHPEHIKSIEFSPDGTTISSDHWNNIISFWGHTNPDKPASPTTLIW